jgi:enamine deaminase RidA (YjgF/YER057c/UK114 family)|tara:strand:+ start:334 stop:792 length:459 start_codon:yes stop_codon:yes gene_type:complete
MDINSTLIDKGIVLPDAPPPAANYIPFVKIDKLVFISGQVSQNEDGFIKGVLGKDLDVEQGYSAARQCGISLLAQLKNAVKGDLNKVTKVVKLGGFVNSALDFTEQPSVINGASDLFVELFGEKGRHARTAVGANLPLGVAVEIDGIFEVES